MTKSATSFSPSTSSSSADIISLKVSYSTSVNSFALFVTFPIHIFILLVHSLCNSGSSKLLLSSEIFIILSSFKKCFIIIFSKF